MAWEKGNHSMGVQGKEEMGPPEEMTLVQTEDDSASLRADVRAIPLAGLLGLIYEEKLSGLLVFSARRHEKSVFLRGGEVVFAASNMVADRLGESLVRAKMLTLDQFKDATSKYQPGVRFGKTLVELGFLSPRELWGGVRNQVEEIVRSLFSYTEGQVRFYEGEFSPDNVVRLALPMQRLVNEGLDRREELLEFLELIKNSQICMQSVGDIGEKLSPQDRDFLGKIDRDKCFLELCSEMKWDPLSAAGRVRHLVKVGALQVDQEEVSIERAMEEEAQVRSLVTDYVKLLGELVLPVVALEGASGIQERLGEVLADTAEHHPELLEGVELNEMAMINPEAVIERALQIDGGAEEIIDLAMSELISYLEFEVKNHPAIPDPEMILEGISDLRAKIGVSAEGQA